MKLLQVLALVSLATLPATASADEQFNDEQIVSILQENAVPIKVIGLLKFCRKSELESKVLRKITGRLMVDLFDSNEQNGLVKLRQVINSIDTQTVGIATGLSLARMAPDTKKMICSDSVALADDLLVMSVPETGR